MVGRTTSGNYIQTNRFQNIGYIPEGYGVGVLIYNNFYAEISSNVMTSVRAGIQTGNFFQGNVGVTWSIHDNTISSTKRGIFHNLAYSTASSLTISNNTLSVLDEAGASVWDGIMLSSLPTSVGIVVVSNTIIATPVTRTTVGYKVWNTPTTGAVMIAGGLVNNANYGVWVNNYAATTVLAIRPMPPLPDVSITGASVAGVFVQNDPRGPMAPLSRHCHKQYGHHRFRRWCCGERHQCRRLGAEQFLFHKRQLLGVVVDAGVALLENNDFTGNSQAGISVLDLGIVDAGDCQGHNATGLGTGSGANGSSAGNNNLSGYGFDNNTPWAISNANSSASAHIYAEHDSFGAGPADSIAAAISDPVGGCSTARIRFWRPHRQITRWNVSAR